MGRRKDRKNIRMRGSKSELEKILENTRTGLRPRSTGPETPTGPGAPGHMAPGHPDRAPVYPPGEAPPNFPSLFFPSHTHARPRSNPSGPGRPGEATCMRINSFHLDTTITHSDFLHFYTSTTNKTTHTPPISIPNFHPSILHIQETF